jgi:hypothetical protein
VAGAAALFHRDQSGLLEHREVLADGLEGHGEGVSELGNGGRALAEAVDDGAAGRVGEGGEDGVEGGVGLEVNHMVEYGVGNVVCQLGG